MGISHRRDATAHQGNHCHQNRYQLFHTHSPFNIVFCCLIYSPPNTTLSISIPPTSILCTTRSIAKLYLSASTHIAILRILHIMAHATCHKHTTCFHMSYNSNSLSRKIRMLHDMLLPAVGQSHAQLSLHLYTMQCHHGGRRSGDFPHPTQSRYSWDYGNIPLNPNHTLLYLPIRGSQM